MYTDVGILNLGLSKISTQRISNISPASTPLERFCAINYQHWKRTEITKRRWVFALEDDYLLTKVDTLEGLELPFKYAMPVDCLRPVRNSGDDWKQRGRYLYSGDPNLRISYIRNAAEHEFDPLFNEVLAGAVAKGTAEFVTQSATKRQLADAEYDRAVADAAKANAFIIGPEDIQEDDSQFSVLTARSGLGVA